MCFDICAINIRVSIRVHGLHLVSHLFMAPLHPFRGHQAQQHYTQTLPQLHKEAALVAQEAAEKLRVSEKVLKRWS
jgi:hypothetical protein